MWNDHDNNVTSYNLHVPSMKHQKHLLATVHVLQHLEKIKERTLTDRSTRCVSDEKTSRDCRNYDFYSLVH